MKKRISLYIMAAFYLLAAINHFRNPEAYYKIIPPYLPYPVLINLMSGIAEMLFAFLLLIPAAKKWACYGIMIMLIAFIPAHIYMFTTGWCIKDFCLPQWAIWLRLILLQPLLILWAWWLKD